MAPPKLSVSVPDWTEALKSRTQQFRVAGSALADSIETGLRPTPRAGRGTEWFGRREYAAGDPFTLVDWRLFARYASLPDPPMYVKTFQSAVANLTTLAVDCSPSMFAMYQWPEEGKLATAFGAAALLAWAAVCHGDLVEIALAETESGDPLQTTALMRTGSDCDRETESLAATLSRREPYAQGASQSIWRALTDPHQGLAGTRHTLVVISDFFASPDRIAAALDELQRHVRNVIGICVLSPWDEDPFPAGRDVELVDVEDSHWRQAAGVDRFAYRQALDRHLGAIMELFASQGAPFVQMRAVRPVGAPSRAAGAEPADVLNTLIESEILL